MNSSSTTRAPEGFSRSQIALWLLLLSILVAVGAYFPMFTGFEPYDDEGSLMAPLKQYMGGMRLYQDVFCFYGPVYYFYNFLVRTLTSTPVTHDVTRMTSLFPWMICCLLGAGITLRLTKSLLMAAISLLLVSRTLVFFSLGPGHPQELTLVLVLAFAACPVWMDLASRRSLLMVALGFLTGALLLIKINIGIFVLASLVLALLVHSAHVALFRYLSYLVGAGCILLPLALMKNHLNAVWGQTYCLLATASIAAAVFWLLKVRREVQVTLRDFVLTGAGCALIAAITVAALAVQHIPLYNVIDTMLFLPARVFNKDWYHAPRFSPLWMAWGLAGLGTALYLLRQPPAPDTPQWRRLFVLKSAVTALTLAGAFLDADLLPLAGPFAWLVLFNPDPAARKAQEFPRTVLCIICVVQTLYAYPVYGGQGRFVQGLLVVVVTVCAGDSIGWLTGLGSTPAWLAHRGHAMATAMLVGLVLLTARSDFSRYRKYRDLPSLGLPGAHRIHVDAEQQTELASMAANIARSCDVFEGLPGIPSFTFWTGRESVTNMNSWMLNLSPDQQTRIVEALSAHPKACIVENPEIARVWNPDGHMDFEALPTVQYIRREFKPVMASGQFRLLIRKDRNWPISGAE